MATNDKIFLAAYRKRDDGQECSGTNHSADKPTLLGRLTDKLVDRLDIHKLSDSVADQLCEKIASSFKTSDLVDRLLDNYHERIQAAITEAIF